MTALPLAAQAWGADGHQTVAVIAAGLIRGTPAEVRVAALLGDMPLPLAAIWADCAKNLFKVSPWRPLPRKSRGCKAQTGDGLGARRGFATRQTLFLRGNPKGKASPGRTLRCPPWPGMSLAGGVRLDCGPGMPCGHHGETLNRF